MTKTLVAILANATVEKPTIYFDMDGTLAALFFVKDFSKKLSAGDMSPYTDARPLYDMEEMKTVVAKLKEKFSIGIISYADKENLEKATTAKMDWLKKYFPYADNDKIHITTKATSKTAYYKDGDILVDDCTKNREEWENLGGMTINAYFRAKIKMIDSLKELIKE